MNNIGQIFGGLLGAPFNAIGGAFSGFFGGLFPGALLWGGGLAALAAFAPSFVHDLAGRAGFAEQLDGLFDERRGGGWMKALGVFGLVGAAISGGLGGIFGALGGIWNGFTGQRRNQHQQQENGGIGGPIVMGGLAIAGVVAIGALLQHNVHGGQNADPAAPQAPPATPRANAGFLGLN